jgi:hypothetical protein
MPVLDLWHAVTAGAVFFGHCRHVFTVQLILVFGV